MRILFISAFYPPYVIGGWEQLIEDINTHFRTRGHETCVLTTTYGVGDQVASEKGVQRSLHLESDLNHYRPAQLFTYERRVQQNLTQTWATIETFKPDVVFIHIMWNLSRGIAWMAEQMMPGRVVYYVADHWLYTPDTHEAFWSDPAESSFRNALKRLIAPLALRVSRYNRQRFPLRLQHVLCVSHAIKDALIAKAAIPPEQARVIYNGIDTQVFAPGKNTAKFNRDTLRLLYAGSLVPHKGVHTVVKAIAVLARQDALTGISLTIAGGGRGDYLRQLKNMVDVEGLEPHVTFRERVPRERMPELLNQFDVLIFPSTWPEPLARMTQEAMASGLIVIGTLTGGTGEILIEGETGLTFPPGDAETLAQRILELRQNPELMPVMAHNARDKVVQQFEIGRMVNELELYLASVAQAGQIAGKHSLNSPAG